MLKIKPEVTPPEIVKFNTKLPKTTLDMLSSYLTAYEKSYGKKTTESFVVNEILLSFFSADKKFQAYLKENTSK